MVVLNKFPYRLRPTQTFPPSTKNNGGGVFSPLVFRPKIWFGGQRLSLPASPTKTWNSTDSSGQREDFRQNFSGAPLKRFLFGKAFQCRNNDFWVQNLGPNLNTKPNLYFLKRVFNFSIYISCFRLPGRTTIATYCPKHLQNKIFS